MTEQHEDEMRGWRSRLNSDESTKAVAVDLLTAYGVSERARLQALQHIVELEARMARIRDKLHTMQGLLDREVWG